MDARYKNLDNDERGVWKSSDLSAGSAVERNIYPIFNPYTEQEIYPPHGRSWVYSQEKLQELIADNRIFFPTSGFRIFRREWDDLCGGAQVEEKVYRY